MKRIKIGQIGICHEHAAAKMNTLRKMTDIYEVVGVVDDRNSPSARFAGSNLEPYVGLKWMTEEELFRESGLQAVAVETPNDDLVPTALRCMKHNLAIHMDKPGGRDLNMFVKLLRGCEKRNLTFQMGYMFRNNPAFQWCRKAVHKGWLGPVFKIDAGMSHDYGGKAYQEYLSHFKGGIMFNLGCHFIDFSVSMMGYPDDVTSFLQSTSGAVNNAQNNGLTVLEYPGAMVSIHACGLVPEGIKHRRLRICGENGTAELSPLERFDGKPLLMTVTFREGNEEYSAGTHTLDFGIIYDRYESQFMELAKIINGEIKNPYSCENDLLTQKVFLAASGYE